MLKNNTEENEQRYKKQRRRCKKVITENNRKFKIIKLEELEEKYTNNEVRNSYQGTKKIKKDHQTKTKFCRNKEGNLIGAKENTIERWAESFEDLLDKQDKDNKEKTTTRQKRKEEKNI